MHPARRFSGGDWPRGQRQEQPAGGVAGGDGTAGGRRPRWTGGRDKRCLCSAGALACAGQHQVGLCCCRSLHMLAAVSPALADYVSSLTLLFPAPCRDNILLGRPLDPGRYHATLRACALHADLPALPGGDAALAGAGGARLSGGQRTRVALARALYADADLLRLDDCLAAVDTRVASWLVQHALLGPLLWKTPGPAASATAHGGPSASRPPRTAIIVTHSAALVAAADVVVRMEGGRVADVQERPPGVRAARLAAAAAAEAEQQQDEQEPSELPAVVTQQQQQHALLPQPEAEAEQEEERAVGHVRWAVWQQYLAATGWSLVAVIVLSLVAMQATRNANDLWLSYWVSHSHSDANPLSLAAAAAAASGGSGGTALLAVASSGAAAPPTAPSLSVVEAGTGRPRLSPEVRLYLLVLLAIAGANAGGCYCRHELLLEAALLMLLGQCTAPSCHSLYAGPSLFICPRRHGCRATPA